MTTLTPQYYNDQTDYSKLNWTTLITQNIQPEYIGQHWTALNYVGTELHWTALDYT